MKDIVLSNGPEIGSTCIEGLFERSLCPVRTKRLIANDNDAMVEERLAA